MSQTLLGPVLGTLLGLKTWLGPVLVSSYGPAALNYKREKKKCIGCRMPKGRTDVKVEIVM